MEYKFTSIVLDKKDVGETDRIYTLYTLEEGKIRVLAKGVRKPQAKLAGSLENFTYSDISVAKNQGIGKITAVVVENSFPSLRRDFFSASKTMSIVNIFGRLVDLGHSDRQIFELLKEFLEAIDSQSLIVSTVEPGEFESRIELLGQVFLFKLLNFLGYGVELKVCPECGNDHSFPSVGDVYFSAKSGGLICLECANKGKAQLRLSHNAVKLMNISINNGIKSLMKVRAEKRT